MAAFVWTSKLETGVVALDDQHKRLFEAINDLGQAFRYGDIAAQIEQSMAFLLNFTLEHFLEEEAWMRTIEYPEIEAHQAEHAKLVASLLALRDRSNAGEHMTRRVTQYLVHWLGQHIEEFDMDYIKHAQARKLGYQTETVN